MELKTEKFTLRKTSPGVEVEVPVNYKITDFITLDFGDKRRNDICVATFQYMSDYSRVVGVTGTCGCMNNSTAYELQDGTQQIKIEYNSNRIGVADTGRFEKVAVAKLSDGSSIKFKIYINEVK